MGRVCTGDSKRLWGLCFGFFLLFFGFFAAQNEVTPVLGSFGSLSLGMLNGCFAASALVAPALLRCLSSACHSCKKGDGHMTAGLDSASKSSLLRAETAGLVVGSLCYAPFIASCAVSSLHWGQMVGSVILGIGAGLLWVSQGSLLTACCTESNRGVWAGRFWAAFMGGNAIGNFAGSAIASIFSVSTLFLVLAAVTVISGVVFGVMVRPRAVNRIEAGTITDAATNTDREHGSRQDSKLTSPLLSSPKDTPTEPPTACAASFLEDMRHLGRIFKKPSLFLLIPLLFFIGAENAFWGGAFPELLKELGMGGSVGLVMGVLAVADMVTSLAAGWVLDKCSASNKSSSLWPPRIILLIGLGAFVGGLALVSFELRPALVNHMHNSTRNHTSIYLFQSVHSYPGQNLVLFRIAYVSAGLMGMGDAIANTVMLARLGKLSDDLGLIPRTTAFQYFQCTDVLMTCAAFVYAPAIPIEASLGQPLLLAGLAAVAFLTFLCARLPEVQASRKISN